MLMDQKLFVKTWHLLFNLPKNALVKFQRLFKLCHSPIFVLLKLYQLKYFIVSSPPSSFSPFTSKHDCEQPSSICAQSPQLQGHTILTSRQKSGPKLSNFISQCVKDNTCPLFKKKIKFKKKRKPSQPNKNKPEYLKFLNTPTMLHSIFYSLDSLVTSLFYEVFSVLLYLHLNKKPLCWSFPQNTHFNLHNGTITAVVQTLAEILP